MRLTRRQVLAGAAAGASARPASTSSSTTSQAARRSGPSEVDRLPEQHLLEGVRIVEQENVEVLVPPLHHEVVTGQADASTPADLGDAQTALESLLADLEADYAPSPAGLGVTVAWGLPYFEHFVPAAATRHLPHDRRADQPALAPSRRFPSDPAETVLEANDLAILLRSDVRAHIDDALARIQRGGLFDVTSLRRGFAGGGFDGGHSLPKQMAMAAGVPGADLIPLGSELFLGFTSTQRAAFGPGKIANFETLGFVDLGPAGYFREGTHLHLSHVTEDLEAWYIDFAFDERVETAFRPESRRAGEHAGRPAGAGAGLARPRTCARQYRASGRIGHSASIQTTSRLQADAVGADGTHYPKGTAIPIRADFNTLDNPFFFSSRPGEVQPAPAAGIHFLVLQPVERRLRAQPARDGRRASGRPDPVPAPRPRPGLQLDPAHDPSPELPRAAAAASQLSARRAVIALRRGGAGVLLALGRLTPGPGRLPGS